VNPHQGAPAPLPAGRAFDPGELVLYAGRGERSLDDALAEADLIVGAPHAGAALPEELEPFLDPAFAASARLRLDFTDVATLAVGRRWAEIDPRIVLVCNPHPRWVRDPDRPRPADLKAQLAEAFARVREHRRGDGASATSSSEHAAVPDLAGADAVRPVTFAGLPVFVPPADDDGLERLAETLREVGSRGVDVYERTRDDLFDRLVAKKLRGATVRSGLCLFLSFHDTMDATAAPEGTIAGRRAPAARMPRVLALANRGDPRGEARGREPVTLWPGLLRRLAEAHRVAFDAPAAQDVVLNRPFFGGHEVTRFGAACRELGDGTSGAGLVFGAAQAEFRREYLLGERAAAHLAEPGTDWPEADPARVDEVARRLREAWDEFRRVPAVTGRR
jgi:hypothetical protein